MTEKRMIAFCGLDCSTCEAHIATKNNDDELRRKVASEWSAMNNAPEITPETINCTGCCSDGVKFYYCSHLCPIRTCAQKKGYKSCGDCPDMLSCKFLSGIIDSNPDALENLKSL